MTTLIESLINTFFKKLNPRLRNRAFPLVVIVAYVFSFGWALPSLGFYLDDWPHLFYHKFGGGEATNLFHAYDGRPLLAWFYKAVSGVFGFEPIYRQMLAVGLRFLTVLFTWGVLRWLWPKANWQVDTAALLFAVYPIFAQQAVSVAFSSHWAAFLCLMVSNYLMFLAIHHRRLFIPLTLASVSFAILQYSLSEYFISLEFLRFLLLYVFAINHSLDKKLFSRERVVWVLKNYSIYFVVWFAFIIWRIFVLRLPTDDRIEPVLLNSLASSPLSAILQLLQWMTQDFFLNTIIVWYKTLTVELFSLQNRTALVFLGMVFIVWLFSSVYLLWVNHHTKSLPYVWAYQGLIVGFFFTVIAPLPGWVTGRSSSLFIGPMSDRFGLPAMFGASILLTAAMDLLLSKAKVRILILALFIGLAAGWQARNTNDFRWSWTFQQRFYQQLIFRIPDLQPSSLIASEQEFLPKVGAYPLGYALNSMYGSEYDPDALQYYYVNLGKEYAQVLDDFVRGEPIFRKRWQSNFIGKTTDGIIIEYRPEDGTCLWVLDQKDALNPLLPDITRRVLSASDLSRILPSRNQAFAGEIFGVPKLSSWCDYYQKAALAVQFKNWDEAMQLWAESTPYHHQINAATELAPFIEAYIQTGKLAEAFELSQQLNQGIRGGANPFVCSIWERSL